MLLTAHFDDAELGVAGVDNRRIRNARFLCFELLEPIRTHFNAPIVIHDGYRDAAHNARVGGKATSWHLFADGQAAADFHVVGVDLSDTFDWIRLASKLPFDKVILEVSGGLPRCVHIQIDVEKQSRRLAYQGSTGDGLIYTPVEVA